MKFVFNFGWTSSFHDKRILAPYLARRGAIATKPKDVSVGPSILTNPIVQIQNLLMIIKYKYYNTNQRGVCSI